MAKTRVVLTRGWEYQVFGSEGTRREVLRAAQEIRAQAIANAPEWPVQHHWNRIRNHISTAIMRDRWGWRAAVVIEANPRVRHALLLERGWTDRGGRRHPGRRFLKAALLKARLDEG